MKAHFGLPSCNYNIELSKEDLELLLSKGYITVQSDRIPCTTSRAVINGTEDGLDFHDRKTIHNNLSFGLSESVSDLQANDWNVQFLCIAINREEDNKNEET